jgi:hypothetical protein
MNVFVRLYSVFANISEWIDRKVLGNYFVPVEVAKLGVRTSDFIEDKIMNGGVRFVTNIFKKLSLLDIKAQSGNVQSYNAYAFIIITIILTCLTLGYSAMLIYMGG